MKDNLYLVGFMGAGKSTVGHLLAERLNRIFIEMDAELEKDFGLPIPEVFRRLGEDEFRRRETALLRQLSKRRRVVAAAGGGAVVSAENRRLMRSGGKIIHLAADLEVCRSRLGKAAQAVRPLWQDEESLRSLFDSRKEAYRDNDLSIPVDGHRSPDDITNEIVSVLYPDHQFVTRLGEKECTVFCSWKAPELLAEQVMGRRLVVLTDRTVARHHLDRLGEAVGDSLVISVQPGERSKTISSARRIYQALLEHHFDRGDCMIALGGGMVTDLGAFVASTWKRGMGFIPVSTSLVGCVDAAVGGKAAVNLGVAKNVVGCFSTPSEVILDIAALKTLGRKHLSEGLVEAYKTGLIAAPELADLIHSEVDALLAGDLPLLAGLVHLSARTKGEVVTRDFRESGLRRILNFGHTFGHAVEGWHRFKVSHGQAVALGMIVAAGLSRSRGLIGDDLFDLITGTVRRISPQRVQCPPADEAWEIMLHDKKIQQGRLVFVLLEDVGRTICVDDVSKSELRTVLEQIREVLDG